MNSPIVPSVCLEPRLVLEVPADKITRSRIHTGGRRQREPSYALRFRSEDRRPEQATSVRELIELCGQR